MTRPRLLTLLAAAAVLTGLLPVLPGAAPVSAAPVLSVYPNTAFTGTKTKIEVVLQSPTTLPQVTVVLTPGDGAGGPYTATLARQGSFGTRFSGEVLLSFLPPGALAPGVADPEHETPAAPGLYGVQVLDPAGELLEECSGCVTLITDGVPRIAGWSSSSVRWLPLQDAREVTFDGSAFADGTVVEVLRGGKVDPTVAVEAASSSAHGHDTEARLTRTLTAGEDAVLGWRDLRFTNTDGRRSTCSKCLVITSLASSVTPVGAETGDRRPVTITSTGVIPPRARPALFWEDSANPDPARDLVGAPGTLVPGPPTTLTGLVDFTGAAPGLHQYRSGFVLQDGSRHDCQGECRFSVRQLDAPTCLDLTPRKQAAGTTRTVTVTGTGLTRGTGLEVGDGVTVTGVAFRSTSSVTLTVTVAAGAEQGPRAAAVTNTDDQSGDCPTPFEVLPPSGSATAPPVPLNGDPELDPDPDQAPAPPRMRLSTAVSTPQRQVGITGSAEPGAVLDLYAYTRPSSTYRLVRSANVPADGLWSATVAPAANTRFRACARNQYGRTCAETVVLHVRPVLVLAPPTDLKGSACRFAVSLAPVRRSVAVRVEMRVGGRWVGLGTVTTDGQGRAVLQRAFAAPVSGAPVRARTAADLVHAAATSAPRKATC